MLIVYVGDITFTTDFDEETRWLILVLAKEFEIKDLGEMKYS